MLLKSYTIVLELLMRQAKIFDTTETVGDMDLNITAVIAEVAKESSLSSQRTEAVECGTIANHVTMLMLKFRTPTTRATRVNMSRQITGLGSQSTPRMGRNATTVESSLRYTARVKSLYHSRRAYQYQS